MVSPAIASITPMTHDRSTRHRDVEAVVNPTARAVSASLAVVVLGPLVAMIAYTHPMLGVGGLLGVLARPVFRLAQRVVRRISHLVDQSTEEPQVAATRASVDASGE